MKTKPGQTLVRPCGFDLRETDNGSPYLIFDIEIWIGIAPEVEWMFQARNFKAMRFKDGRIRFKYPKTVYIPRHKRKYTGAAPKSMIFINEPLLSAIRAEIEDKFGKKLTMAPDKKKPTTTIQRFRTDDPEEAIQKLEERKRKLLEDGIL